MRDWQWVVASACLMGALFLLPPAAEVLVWMIACH